MSNMVLVDSIRTMHLCDLGMHEVCWVSDTTLPIFSVHIGSCAVALQMARYTVHGQTTSLVCSRYSLVYLCYNSLQWPAAFECFQQPLLTIGKFILLVKQKPAALHSSCRNGMAVCRGLKPLDIRQLLFAKGDLYFVLVNPKFEAPTAEMRAVLPKMVPMLSAINNSAMGGSLVGHIVI